MIALLTSVMEEHKIVRASPVVAGTNQLVVLRPPSSQVPIALFAPTPLPPILATLVLLAKTAQVSGVKLPQIFVRVAGMIRSSIQRPHSIVVECFVELRINYAAINKPV